MNQTILLVEDDASVADVLKLILRRLGPIEHVGTGAGALTRIDKGGIALVVLDLGLPDLDGVDVCRGARARGYTGAVLVHTARHGSQPRELAFQAGADDFLNKPFTVPDLLGRARALLGEGAGAPT